MASFLRAAAFGYIASERPHSYLLASIDACFVYAITLLAGLVAGWLYKKQVLLTGFCAGALGELARGTIKLLLAVHVAGWITIFSVPLAALLDIGLAALPAGLLGAAGAAVAVVTIQDRVASTSP